MKKTRVSLLTSLVTLLLCSSMFVGSTFAWFTDTVSSTGNRIQAGTLKIDLLMDKQDGNGYKSIANGTGDIFKEATKAQNATVTLWEPGKTQFAYLAVENKGTLALKYNIIIDVTDEGLANSLEYAIIPTGHAPATTGPASLANWDAVKALANGLTGTVTAGRTTAAEGGVLDEIVNETKNERDYFILAVHMKEAAGNDYQDKDAIIDVTIVATQMTAEKDGFDSDQYDKDAKLPFISSASTSVNKETEEDIDINAFGNIKKATVSKDAANGVFNDMKDDEAELNDLTLTLKVTEKDNTTEGIYNVVNLDIDVTAIMISVKDGVETKNEKNVKELDGYTIFNYQLPAHKENVVARHSGHEMVKLNSVDDITKVDNGYGFYFYNSEDGMLTIKTKTFSPFTVSYDMENWQSYAATNFATPIDTENKIVTIGNAEELTLFAKNISSYDKYTAKLANDIDLSGKLWTPISSWNGSFEGQNHTITGMTICAQKNYGNGFISYFGNSGTGYMKDVTFEDALVQYGTGIYKGNVYGIVAGYAGYYGTATFENVKVKNSMIWGFGKVGGIVGMSEDATGSKLILKNCSVSNTTIKGTYNVASFVGLVQGQIDISGCTSSNVKWEKSSSDVYYEITDSTTNLNGNAISGIYWRYDNANLFAGWSDLYNDYYNWNVYENGEESVTYNNVNYDFDGYCHN